MWFKQVTNRFLGTNSHSIQNFNSILKRLLSVSVANDGNLMVVDPKNGDAPLKFPSVWLRDNCQCSECFHDTTNSRTINWLRTNFDIRIKDVKTEKDHISINWSDKHKSTFSLGWLKERDFSPENRQRYIQNYCKQTPQLWGKDQYEQVLRTFDFSDVIKDDKALLGFLEAVAVQGFSILKNAPSDVTVVRQIADRIGYIKRTTYGEVFEVKSKENASNYAYHMTPLPLHTDMPYYEYKAGINILHCMVQSQSAGGANLMADGFYVADKVRQNYPEYFEILLKTPVNWFDVGTDSISRFHNVWRSPVICLDVDGNFHRINQNITKRDSFFTVPLEQVDPWYKAYDKFLQIANEEAVQFKTMPGDVFVFHNIRMLHGRTAYMDSPENKRHLIGAYVDWDIINSKIRVLKYHNSK